MRIIITDIGDSGDGIGRSDEGLVVFVPGTLPGDVAEVEITENNGRFAKGRLVSLAEKSPDRLDEPRCPNWEKCGGCPLMGLKYEAQLGWKQKKVEETLKRIAKLEDPVVRPIQGMDHPYYYRNKAEFAVEDGRVGYYAPKSHELVDCAGCVIQLPQAMQAAFDFKIMPVKGAQRLIVRTARTGELMAYYTYRDGTAKLFKGSNLIHDWVVTDRMDIKVEVGPEAFYQVNPSQCTRLYSVAQEYACLTGDETVLDLYCGAGSIGLTMAHMAKRIIGVESVKQAVIDANRNAVINGIVNAEFIHGKAEDVVPKRLQGVKAEVVVLDPPRAGCKPALLDTVAEIAPDRIVYVSCNPATLARDIAYLADKGYIFAEATPVDMFPHTLSIECAALLVYNIR